MTTEPAPAASTPTPRPAESEGIGLLRSAFVLGLILAILTLGILLVHERLESWHPGARLEIHGDTWDGNLATDGDRVYLMTREEIAGFWGVLYVRASGDGGRTWSEPVQVSAAGGPSAARHTVTVGPDGSVWAAWAQQGQFPSTQQLILRRSRDHGLTWDAPIRASRGDVGLVGIPALVMTEQRSFIAFTDGERGTVLVQELDPDGGRPTDPVAVRSTTRELYDDAPFFDAGIGAAAVGSRGVLALNDGDQLWRATTAGPGEPWVTEMWYAAVAYSPPRLAAVDGRLTALASVLTGDSVQISSETSSNGGLSWDGGATWHDRYAGVASLAVASDQTAVLWESCDQFCSSSILRLGNADAADGRASRIDGSAGWSAGTLLTDDTMVVAWVEDGPDHEAEQRNLVVATGPRP